MDRNEFLYVALLGGQTAPTLLGLLRDGKGRDPRTPRYPTHLHLVYTEGSRWQLHTILFTVPVEGSVPGVDNQWLQSAQHDPDLRERLLSIPPMSVSTACVSPYGFDEVEQEVARVIEGFSGPRVRVDITGGTKPMHLGSFLAADRRLPDAAKNVDIHYVISETNRYASHHVHCPGDCISHALQCEPREGQAHWCEADFPSSFPELSPAALIAAYGYELI